MKIFILLFLTSIISSSFAEVAKIPCVNKDGTVGLNSLDTFDCQLASKITKDPTIRKEYKSHIDKKLAQIVARKTSDVIEDISLLDSYLDQNDIDLGEDDSVKEKCQLKKISEPVCTNGVTPAQVQKKLDLILGNDKYLPRYNLDNNNFYKRMIAKASQVRDGTKINEKICPINGHSGAFILDSQFTYVRAKDLIENLQRGKESAYLKKLYEEHPQLKMLVNGKDDSLKKKFESEMLKITSNDVPKNFVNDFFKNKDVQKAMAASVGNKCDELSMSIKKFACEINYTQISLNEDDRDTLFDNDVEKDDPIFKEVSRGLSCEVEEKATGEEAQPLFSEEGSVHQSLKILSKDIRKHKNKSEVDDKVELFCNNYLCKDKDSLALYPSCKNGGPLSSKDFLLSCRVKGDLSTCDGKIQNYYEFVASMERDAKNSGIKIQGMASTSQSSDFGNEDIKKPRGYSTFYQNFLGVEGTIAAEGKKITPITVAEKKAEFVEKKLDANNGTSAGLTSGNKETARVEVKPEPVAQIESARVDEHAASVRQADEYRRAIQAQQFSKPNYEIGKDASGKTKKVKFTDTESSTIDEMKKLRTELAEALGKVKGTEEEQLATIADNNASVVAPVGVAKSPVRNLNNGEKERLDAYRESLNNWENRLRNWQGNITDREVRANNAASAAAADRGEAVVPNADQVNNRGTANSVKLSKSSAAGATGAGKAEGANDRAPGTENADVEAGIVNSDSLATLEKTSLKKHGIIATDSFIIKVRHKDKIYSVPVKTFNHGGKEMYVPLLNEKDRELSKIVYDSPLFKDYRDYQVQRQYKLDQI